MAYQATASANTFLISVKIGVEGGEGEGGGGGRREGGGGRREVREQRQS